MIKSIISTHPCAFGSLVRGAVLLTGVSLLQAQTVAVPDGYATGTTGGGNATPITVSTATAFRSAVDNNNPAVIIVSGRLDVGAVSIGSNKTILGANTSSGLYGGALQVRGTNYIFQNLTIGPSPTDGMEVSGARNVFIHKCDFYDGADGSLDIVRQADFITVSWCKFYYVNQTNHKFSNLIGNGDDVTADAGKLHVTMHHNWYAQGVNSRMPRVRFGHVHIYNNYYNSVGNGYCIGVGVHCRIRVENSHFDNVRSPWSDYGGVAADGKIGWANLKFTSATQPTFIANSFPLFTPPYTITMDPVDHVKSLVMAGAGNVILAQGPIPAAPTGLSATAGNAQVSLTWNASSGATGYHVKRATTSGGTYTNVASPAGTSFVNTGLTNGTTYYYVVSALNGGVESVTNSNQASATPSGGLLETPTTIQAESGTIAGGTIIDTGSSSNSGWNGTGYANFPTTGGSLQFNNINGGSGGTATLAIRFAVGGTNSRTGNLVINGVTHSITFPSTTTWGAWTTMDVPITLVGGANNTIRFESSGQDLANLDEITLVVSAATPTVVTITATDASAGEYGNDQDIAFTITRTGATTAALTVPLVASGTATVGSDYSGFVGSVTILIGQSSAVLPLTVLPDALSEGPETVIISLGASTAFTAGSPDTASATIDDTPSQAYYFSTIANPAKRGPTDDADGDSHSNIIEYFMGTHPDDSASHGVLTIPSVGTGTFKVRYPRAVNRPDVSGSLRWSSNMTNWHASGQSDGSHTVNFVETVVSDLEADPETVEATATITGPGDVPMIFVRLHVQ